MTKSSQPRKRTAAGSASLVDARAKDDQPPVELTIDDLALGELAVPQALTLLRASLDQPDIQTIARVYEALRALAWKKFAERVVGEEMRQWHDLFRQAAALFDVANSGTYSQRAAAFADLAIESVRFGNANSIDDMRARAHVRDILVALSKRGGTALRSAVMHDTHLKQANLSRVLAHMAAAGFVDRRPSGREVVVSLTSLGREAISSPPRHGANALMVSPPLDEEPSPRLLRRSQA
jgi:predicted transcriptional regulator